MSGNRNNLLSLYVYISISISIYIYIYIFYISISISISISLYLQKLLFERDLQWGYFGPCWGSVLRLLRRLLPSFLCWKAYWAIWVGRYSSEFVLPWDWKTKYNDSSVTIGTNVSNYRWMEDNEDRTDIYRERFR